MASVDASQLAQFGRDVADHVLTIDLDSGAHRRLRCSKPGDDGWHLRFDVVTWPGRLAISGDVAEYTFRLDGDPFSYFRRLPDAPGRVRYLAEKVIAEDHKNPVMVYDHDLFVAAVAAELRDLVPGPTRAAIVDLLERDPFESATEACDAAAADAGLDDFWEHALESPSLAFRWCVRAIAWAVAKYDAAKDEEAACPG